MQWKPAQTNFISNDNWNVGLYLPVPCPDGEGEGFNYFCCKEDVHYEQQKPLVSPCNVPKISFLVLMADVKTCSYKSVLLSIGLRLF